VIKIVTVEREYGCGGGVIARRLADRLGWHLWDHEITAAIAKRLKCKVAAVEQREERLDPTFYRLMKTFMRGSYEDNMGGSGLEVLDADFLAHFFEKLVNEIAAQGNCVIVGRGAPWFLRDRKDAYHIFLYASHEEKIRRITADGKSLRDAEEVLQHGVADALSISHDAEHGRRR
jgi:cytidylate kinase